jgi:hypothetical protein
MSTVIYQLTKGSKKEAAIHVAEVTGKTEIELLRLGMQLLSFGDPYGRGEHNEYIGSDTATLICSFVDPATKKVHNIAFQLGAGAKPSDAEINKLVMAALTLTPLTKYSIQSSGVTPTSPEPSLSLTHLALYY